jgi:hypothetical protein
MQLALLAAPAIESALTVPLSLEGTAHSAKPITLRRMDLDSDGYAFR